MRPIENVLMAGLYTDYVEHASDAVSINNFIPIARVVGGDNIYRPPWRSGKRAGLKILSRRSTPVQIRQAAWRSLMSCIKGLDKPNPIESLDDLLYRLTMNKIDLVEKYSRPDTKPLAGIQLIDARNIRVYYKNGTRVEVRDVKLDTVNPRHNIQFETMATECINQIYKVFYDGTFGTGSRTVLSATVLGFKLITINQYYTGEIGWSWSSIESLKTSEFQHPDIKRFYA